jgi:hypothetical protein
MNRLRRGLEGIACLERQVGLPVYLEDEVALDNVTAVDPWMGVTTCADARSEFHNRSDSCVALRIVEGVNDSTLDASLLCDGRCHNNRHCYTCDGEDLHHQLPSWLARARCLIAGAAQGFVRKARSTHGYVRQRWEPACCNVLQAPIGVRTGLNGGVGQRPGRRAALGDVGISCGSFPRAWVGVVSF